MRTVEWYENKIRVIDQRQLPWELILVEFDNYTDVAQALSEMVVRGAPAIGAAAAFGMALAAQQFDAQNREELLRYLKEAATVMKQSRPTAANLDWAIEQVMDIAQSEALMRVEDIRAGILRKAQQIANMDVELNRRMATYGAELIQDGDTILHHSNTGALSAVDWGTALGVVKMAHLEGKRIHAFLGETRPHFQGARLAAWELKQADIPFNIIADSAAGHYMQRGEVNIVLAGAERAAVNGDVANKIGTYQLAVLAKENGIPFYCVFPTSTIDLDLISGSEISIEEQDPDDIRTPLGNAVVPADYPARNPAFDITPQRYITGIITENGIAYPPYEVTLPRVIEGTLYPSSPTPYQE